MFERTDLQTALRARGEAWTHRSIRVLERPSAPLALAAYGGATLRFKLEYDGARTTTRRPNGWSRASRLSSAR